MARAQQLIAELGITDPADLDLELIAAHHNVLVERSVLERQEGCLLRSDDLGIVVVGLSAFRSRKWRFVLAHELGHYLLHPDTDQFALCTDTDLWGRYKASRIETEANSFAAELLMPEPLFRPLCDRDRPTLDDIAELAEMFQTSLTSTALRFMRFCDEPCAVVHATRSVIDWFHHTEDFLVPLRAGMTLDDSTYAGDLFAGRPTSDRPEAIEPYGWQDATRSERLDVGLPLYEQSWRVSPESVLTLLWHPFTD